MSDDLRIHAICTYLRDGPYKLCPASEPSPYGECIQACRMAAEEVASIAIHGNPWGADAIPANVEQWKRSYNNG